MISHFTKTQKEQNSMQKLLRTIFCSTEYSAILIWNVLQNIFLFQVNSNSNVVGFPGFLLGSCWVRNPNECGKEACDFTAAPVHEDHNNRNFMTGATTLFVIHVSNKQTRISIVLYPVYFDFKRKQLLFLFIQPTNKSRPAQAQAPSWISCLRCSQRATKPRNWG